MPQEYVLRCRSLLIRSLVRRLVQRDALYGVKGDFDAGMQLYSSPHIVGFPNTRYFPIFIQTILAILKVKCRRAIFRFMVRSSKELTIRYQEILLTSCLAKDSIYDYARVHIRVGEFFEIMELHSEYPL